MPNVARDGRLSDPAFLDGNGYDFAICVYSHLTSISEHQAIEQAGCNGHLLHPARMIAGFTVSKQESRSAVIRYGLMKDIMLTKTRRYGLPGNPATLPALLLAQQLPTNQTDPVHPAIIAAVGQGIEGALGFVRVGIGSYTHRPGQRIIVALERWRLASDGAGTVTGED